jgi:hypothetical protein
MTEAEWRAQRERYEAFMATDLGKLYRAHDHALIDYWRRDADDSVSDRRLKELDAICREATNAFVAKLMEIAALKGSPALHPAEAMRAKCEAIARAQVWLEESECTQYGLGARRQALVIADEIAALKGNGEPTS